MSAQLKAIPLVQSGDRKLNQAQLNIIQTLNKLISNPLLSGSILTSVNLVTGNNTISHGLGRTLQGWFIVRYHGSWAQIFDNQDTNSSPSTTLILNASAPVKVDVYVF